MTDLQKLPMVDSKIATTALSLLSLCVLIVVGVAGRDGKIIGNLKPRRDIID